MTTLTSEEMDTIQNSKYVVVADTETTGLSPDKGASLLEVGAVRVDVERKKIVGKFSEFVHPMMNFGKVPAKITEMTGIKESDVANAAEQEEVMVRFWRFVGDMPLVFHNAPFDWRFLERAFNGIGVRPVNTIIDTVRMSKAVHPGQKSHSLTTLTAQYGHPIEGHHRAVVDANYTASLYIRMRDELPQQNLIETSVPDTPKTVMYSADDLRVLRVRYWENGNRQRIYVTTPPAVFYYDIGRKVWAVSDLRLEDKSLNLQTCSEKILSILKMDLSSFIAEYKSQIA